MKNIFNLLIALLLTTASFAQHTKSSNKSEKPVYKGDEECYCNFEFQFTQYIDYTAALQESIRRQWFNNQKRVLKAELDDRFNQSFDSFEDGMRHLFKTEFTDKYEDDLLRSIYKTDLNAKNALYPDIVATNAKWRVFNFRLQDLQSSNPDHDLGELSYFNKPVNTMTYNEAYQAYISTKNENYYLHAPYQYHNNRLLRNTFINDRDQFSAYLTNLFMNHLLSMGYEDIVTLATGYLIIDFVDRPLVSPLPTNFYGVPFYWPYNYDFNNAINNLMSNSGLP